MWVGVEGMGDGDEGWGIWRRSRGKGNGQDKILLIQSVKTAGYSVEDSTPILFHFLASSMSALCRIMTRMRSGGIAHSSRLSGIGGG